MELYDRSVLLESKTRLAKLAGFQSMELFYLQQIVAAGDSLYQEPIKREQIKSRAPENPIG